MTKRKVKSGRFKISVVLVLMAILAVALLEINFFARPISTAYAASLAGKKVLIIGDSIGVGDGSRLSSHFRTDGGSATNFGNIAVSGTKTNEWNGNPRPNSGDKNLKSRLTSALQSLNPDIVFVFLGTNDACIFYNTNTISSNAAGILSQLQGRTVVWVGPSNFGTCPANKVAAANQQIGSVVSGNSFFNTQARLPNLPISSDNIHPTSTGYTQLADATWALFSSNYNGGNNDLVGDGVTNTNSNNLAGNGAALGNNTNATQGINGLPSVPGPGGPINPNDINTIPGLISYIYNLAFWLVGIAVFFQVLRAGFIIFFGAAGSASKVSEGKKIITNAIVGLVLLFASWMILNVINPDLVKNTFDFGSLLQGSSENGAGHGDGSGTGTGSGGTGGTGTGGTGTGTGTGVVAAGSCQAGPNALSGNGRCYSDRCAVYSSAVNQYAGGVASAALLRSIMWIESKCSTSSGTQSPTGPAGLMQFTSNTAIGVSNTPSGRACNLGITFTRTNVKPWLKDVANYPKQICLAAAYINEQLKTYCYGQGGNSIRNLSGGYNQGEGTCAYANNNLSCDGGRVRKYELITEGRNYAQAAFYCMNHQ